MVYQLVHDLPDAYAKPVRYREEDTATNTWRLFALIEQQSKQFLDEVQSQANQLDISQCTGGALDAMGEIAVYNLQLFQRCICKYSFNRDLQFLRL